jgi:hypothetical protein
MQYDGFATVEISYTPSYVGSQQLGFSPCRNGNGVGVLALTLSLPFEALYCTSLEVELLQYL